MVAITAETVAAAADRLQGDGTNPTQSAVRTALGGGSFSTIGPLLQEWRDNQAEAAELARGDLPDTPTDAGSDLMSRVWKVAITAETVAAAADRLQGDGTNPTQSAVRTALGGGSFSTIGPLLQKWRDNQAEAAELARVDLPDTLADAGSDLMSRVWKVATTAETVAAAADRLQGDGTNPTQSAIRTALGGGSFSTIGPLLQKWRDNQAEAAELARGDLPDTPADAGSDLMSRVWKVAITAETVAAAADRLQGDGTNPTQSAVRTALGGGSFSTIGPLLHKWRDNQAEAAEPGRVDLPDTLADAGSELMSRVRKVAITEALANHDALRKELIQAQVETEHARKETTDVAASLEADLAQSAGQAAELKAANDRAISTERDLTGAQERAKAEAACANRPEAQLEDQTVTVKKIEADMADLRERLDTAMTQLAEQKAEAVRITSERDHAQKSLITSEARLEKIEVRAAKLQADLTRTQSDLATARSDLVTARDFGGD